MVLGRYLNLLKHVIAAVIRQIVIGKNYFLFRVIEYIAGRVSACRVDKNGRPRFVHEGRVDTRRTACEYRCAKRKYQQIAGGYLVVFSGQYM